MSKFSSHEDPNIETEQGEFASPEDALAFARAQVAFAEAWADDQAHDARGTEEDPAHNNDLYFSRELGRYVTIPE